MSEHQWQTKEGYRGSPYDERFCPVCRLDDLRTKHGDLYRKGSDDGWKVKTPCIEPVPERIGFDALTAELKEHPVEIHIETGIRRTRTFDDAVFCTGRPGKWRVGFDLYDGLFPDDRNVSYKTLEEAYAALLRWMRARQYNPYIYSRLHDMQETARIRASSAAYDDD